MLRQWTRAAADAVDYGRAMSVRSAGFVTGLVQIVVTGWGPNRELLPASRWPKPSAAHLLRDASALAVSPPVPEAAGDAMAALLREAGVRCRVLMLTAYEPNPPPARAAS